MTLSKALRQRIVKLKLISFDVDGVLTDGRLYYADNGAKFSTFNVRDGYGMKQLQKMGIEVALLSARADAQVARRARELGIGLVFQGIADKAQGFRELCERVGCDCIEAAHMGDDRPDLPAMKLAGIAIAPADAVAEVLDSADIVTAAAGGMGAVREVCELIGQQRIKAP